MKVVAMLPSQVRDYVLKDHADLRVQLAHIEADAFAMEGGTLESPLALLEGAETLLSSLRIHMEWEDRYLARALREADAWGPEREARLLREHLEQREMLLRVISGLRELRDEPARLAGKVLELVHLVREDMLEEEFCLLDTDVLRDDVVGIDVEAG